MSGTIEIDARLLAQAIELLEAARARGESSSHGRRILHRRTCRRHAHRHSRLRRTCFERGFVTYSNSAKSEMLGVPVWLIERHGAVSEDVARAMTGGALTHSRASLAVSVTGIAGPDGGTAEKPVGLVHFAAGRRDQSIVHERVLFGDLGRAEIRRRSVAAGAEAAALIAVRRETLS